MIVVYGETSADNHAKFVRRKDRLVKIGLGSPFWLLLVNATKSATSCASPWDPRVAVRSGRIWSSAQSGQCRRGEEGRTIDTRGARVPGA